MGIRDWLAIIVIVFIVLILLDGFRRKWLERKNRIVMKLDKSIPSSAEEDDDEDVLVRSELPAGGARIKTRSGSSAMAEAVDDDVPVLMESVDLVEDEIDEYQDAEDDVEYPDGDAGNTQDYADTAEDIEDSDTTDEDDVTDWDEPEEEGPVSSEPVEEKQAKRGFLGGRGKSEERIEPTFGDESFGNDSLDVEAFADDEMTFSRDDQGELDLEHHDLFDHDPGEEADVEGDEQEQAEEVIIINVMARTDATIEGKKLLPVLLKHGMRLGEMSIFHRHADSDGKGPIMFSMANMLKPGTFSMAEMEEFTTPGVCFFMQLPNKTGNMHCFEQMLNTADAVKDELDAVLKDENRSVFTRQTIEHSRQRIRDFELEMLARK